MSLRNPSKPRKQKIIQGLPTSIFELPTSLDGNWQPFDYKNLAGNVVYAVNVASNDSKADVNYEAMVRWHSKYAKKGLSILAFPCNFFGQKEPKANDQIRAEMEDKYGVKFQIMDKDDIEFNHLFLMGEAAFPEETIWNFHGKYLFDRKGKCRARFNLLTPFEEIEEKIGELLLEQV